MSEALKETKTNVPPMEGIRMRPIAMHLVREINLPDIQGLAAP
jgi:hypothetical protein